MRSALIHRDGEEPPWDEVGTGKARGSPRSRTVLSLLAD